MRSLKFIAPLFVVAFGVSYALGDDSDSKADQLKGRVAVIHAMSAGGGSGPTPLNVGGLLVVEITDSGSRPPKNMSVKVGRAFERLGQLRGIHTDKNSGKPLMGGGYTWFLFKPVNKSDMETVEVTYTPAEGSPKTETYKVKISDAKEDSDEN